MAGRDLYDDTFSDGDQMSPGSGAPTQRATFAGSDVLGYSDASGPFEKTQLIATFDNGEACYDKPQITEAGEGAYTELANKGA